MAPLLLSVPLLPPVMPLEPPTLLPPTLLPAVDVAPLEPPAVEDAPAEEPDAAMEDPLPAVLVPPTDEELPALEDATTTLLLWGRELLLTAEEPPLPPCELARELDIPTLLPPVDEDDDAGVPLEEDVLSSPVRPVHPTANTTSTAPAQLLRPNVMVPASQKSRGR